MTTAVLIDWIAGDCWRCDRSGLLVTWVGPVQWDGQSAPIYLCESCLIAVEVRAHRYFLRRRPATQPTAVVVRPHIPAFPPERTPVPPKHHQPVHFVSISLSGLGIRASAEGRTGLDAWRIIRRRHPRLTLAVAVYALLLTGGLAALVLSCLVA